jgi:hypothetical protein
VDGLLALHAPDVRKFAFPPTPGSEGRESKRGKYKRNFPENPCLNVKILEMRARADKVVPHDLVTGLANGKTSEERVVRQVEDGQITDLVHVGRQLR